MDRFQREITGNSTHLEDGGLAVDALMLIRQNGLVGTIDFHEVVDSDPVFTDLSRRLVNVSGADAKLKALNGALARDLGARRRDPARRQDADAGTTRKGRPRRRAWTEYDVTRDDGAPASALRRSRRAAGDAVHYVDLTTAIALIHDSLARGERWFGARRTTTRC